MAVAGIVTETLFCIQDLPPEVKRKHLSKKGGKKKKWVDDEERGFFAMKPLSFDMSLFWGNKMGQKASECK